MRINFRKPYIDKGLLHQLRNCIYGLFVISLYLFSINSYADNISTKKSCTISLNQDWLFGGEFQTEYFDSNFDDSNFEKITIPHCVSELSWQNWNVDSWQKVYGYRKHFSLPQIENGSRVILHFDGVMVGATPCINGHKLKTHLGGYLPFEYDITSLVKEENILTVAVDSRWSNVPPQGASMGPKRIVNLEPGGIIDSVYLKIVPQTYIKNVFCKTEEVLKSSRKMNVLCMLDAVKSVRSRLTLKVRLEDKGRVISEGTKDINVKKGNVETSVTLSNLSNIILWDIDNPKLYDVFVTLHDNGKAVHSSKTRIGFRSAEFKLDGFYLNGKRLQLFGLNRHELYPYVGYAMPDRVMRRDAEILKNDYNCNIVRCSHYPQTEAFLDACDELGLLVWDEIPGWGYIGDKEWKKLLVRDVEEMIIRDRNHPSIIIWGTRVNESKSDIELYKETRALASKLDDTRPTSGSMTSGTRKTWEKDWSQDVFAYDDYHADPDGSVGIHEPTPGYPYMLAEAVGQFNYAALKDFNCYYSRQVDLETLESQALRHAEAHSKSAATKRNSGVVAWCAFDYGSLINAFKTVKTPGIADVFRIPKLGASFYLAQCNPKERVTLEPNFYWSFSEKSPNGPGKEAVIFSNCEQLRLYIDGGLYATLNPDNSKLPNVKYPPFFVDLEFDGDVKPGELRLEGYIKGMKVIEKRYSSDVKWNDFLLQADDDEIAGDGIDATRVVFGITDKYGSLRPYGDGLVEFCIDGPGEIVGDNPFDLSENGGCGAVWIRSKQNSSGIITLRAKSSYHGVKTVKINVK